MKKMFWNKFKVRSAAAVLAAALAFSMSAPLALAAQPEEAAASAGTVQEADMPTLQPETPELAAEDPEAPPVQATEAEENSTNQQHLLVCYNSNLSGNQFLYECMAQNLDRLAVCRSPVCGCDRNRTDRER